MNSAQKLNKVSSQFLITIFHLGNDVISLPLAHPVIPQKHSNVHSILKMNYQRKPSECSCFITLFSPKSLCFFRYSCHNKIPFCQLRRFYFDEIRQQCTNTFHIFKRYFTIYDSDFPQILLAHCLIDSIRLPNSAISIQQIQKIYSNKSRNQPHIFFLVWFLPSLIFMLCHQTLNNPPAYRAPVALHLCR